MADASNGYDTTSRNVVLYLLVLAYLLSLVCVAVLARRRKSKAQAAGRELQAHFGGSFSAPLLVLTTFSTVYSGFTVTGIPAEASKRGFVSLRWVGATVVIVASMMVLYPRLRRLAVERKYSSPIDFVADRFGTMRLRLLSAVCGFCPMLIYVTAQMLSFAAMVQGFTSDSVPKWAIILLLCISLLVFEKLGGMNSVVLTDAVQSAIMLISFLLVPFALGASFGFLPEIAPVSCGSLIYVRDGAAAPDEAPPACSSEEVAASLLGANSTGLGRCVAAGCLAMVKPAFYEYPTSKDQVDIFYFLLNMLAAPLQPHMVQRAYIASSDGALRIMMGAMLLAPFIAQTPGILIGLTKAAYAPALPEEVRQMTAFSAVSEMLSAQGVAQYLLVSVMTCATMAAIMSTADSAIMGASSLAIDVYRSTVDNVAPERLLVKIGGLVSVGMCIAAFGLAMWLSVGQLSSIIVFQNGMLMQLVPVFGLGLYFRVKELAVTCGIAAGLLTLLVLVIVGNPLDQYMPLVNVSVFANFAVVAAVQLLSPVASCSSACTPSITGAASETAAETARPADDGINKDSAGHGALTPAEIRECMAAVGEPSKPLIALLLTLVLVSIPWYQSPGGPEPIIWGLPRWGFVQVWLFVAACLAGLVAVVRWAPGAGVVVKQAAPAETNSSPPELTVAEEEGQQAPATLLGAPAAGPKEREVEGPDRRPDADPAQPSGQAAVL